MIRFSAVVPSEPDILIDLADWQEDPGKSGGFGTAWFNSTVTTHILKRLHDEIPRTESLRKKSECAGHARAIITRLTEIIEREGQKAPRPFVKAMCETLRDTVTTHVGYDLDARRIFLYQKIAQGTSMEEAFLDEEPEWAERVKIAKNFVAAMVALRRCSVVHLDCRPVNVFVDRNDPYTKVTLIDLDGCGVISSGGSAEAKDSWDVRPTTFGVPTQDIRPIWFPFDASWQSPVSGNFKYAERWSVVNETWRILSWSRISALGWLSGDYGPLIDGFSTVREDFDLNGRELDDIPARYELWRECQHAIHSELAPLVGEALEETRELRWDEFGLGDGSEDANTFLESLAGATIIGMMFHKWGESWNSVGNLREIPSAKWIQDQLIPLLGRRW